MPLKTFQQACYKASKDLLKAFQCLRKFSNAVERLLIDCKMFLKALKKPFNGPATASERLLKVSINISKAFGMSLNVLENSFEGLKNAFEKSFNNLVRSF